jgi:hypothetical protein
MEGEQIVTPVESQCVAEIIHIPVEMISKSLQDLKMKNHVGYYIHILVFEITLKEHCHEGYCEVLLSSSFNIFSLCGHTSLLLIILPEK